MKLSCLADTCHHQFTLTVVDKVDDLVEIVIDGSAQTCQFVYLALKNMFCAFTIIHESVYLWLLPDVESVVYC